MPAHLTDIEAATLPCAALTAWSALVTYSTTRPGDRVLVQGCGGVALFAVAFAKLLGAHVTVISSSDERIERVKAARRRRCGQLPHRRPNGPRPRATSPAAAATT